MALAEFGQKFPCTTQGQQIPMDDPQLEMQAGDVVEAYFDSDHDITQLQALKCLQDILKMKEQYPLFVLHYIKIDTRRITMQYSIAPEGAHGSVVVTVIIALTILVVVSVLAYLTIRFRQTGYWWYPVGWAAISVKDLETDHLLSGVKVYVDGQYAGKTDGSVVNKKLRTGQHICTADLIEGYDQMYPVTAIVTLNQTVPVTIYLKPKDYVPPDTGWVDIYTSPSGALASIDGGAFSYTCPCSIELSVGEHTVAFDDIEGYVTPDSISFTIAPGRHIPVSVTYHAVEEPPWQRYVIYGLTAVAVIAGATIAVPKIITALKKKE